MAEDKKSFVLYCDLLHTVRKLSDEQAGKLFKHILEYVNDNEPTTDDALIDIVFEPIRQSLKRDLQKYLNRVEKNRLNGAKGGRPKKPTETEKTQSVILKPKKADSDNDSDSVSDSDTVSTKVDLFLDWFNKQKEKHTGKLGNFKVLSTTDVNNLKQLKKKYNNSDFEAAFCGMMANQWVKENNQANPAHFLRVDNFNRYLDNGTKDLPKLDRMVAHTALQAGGSILQKHLDKGYTVEQLKQYANQ